MSNKPPITKAELAQRYGISSEMLKKLMNQTYFEELSLVGYCKTSVYLSPKIIRKFIECHGEPLSHEEV